MTMPQTDSLKMLLDFEALQAETIALEPTHIDQALHLCSQIQDEEQQWQTYLNAIALFSFEQWLSDRAPEIAINRENCSLLQPQYANIIDAVWNLKIGDFKLCLTAMGSLTDEAITISKAAIESPEFIAHFYVVVEVEEELEQATIQGFLSYEQLLDRLRCVNLQAEPDLTYQLPMTWFDNDVDRLLLYLRYLEPTPIPLPTPEPTSRSADMVKLLTQPFVNVGRWLRDEMDEFAQGLSWVLLPAFAPEAIPLRSPTQELEVIITEVQRTGTQIPANARGAYQDLQLAQSWVRLYAVTWPLLSPENIPEWKLLLVLGAQPGYMRNKGKGYNLPHGTMMRVSDDTSVLVERVLSSDSDDTYIYACVVGTWDETFIVTIALSNGATLTLPPFAFCPN